MTASSKTDEPILVVGEVTKRFGGLRAVDRATFAVAQGSITALIGPNGAGKTTLLDLIDGLASHRVARRGIVRTFQLTRVFAAMSVRDNMMLGAQRQAGEHLHRLVFSRAAVQRTEDTAHERAEQLMRAFALDSKASEYAGALSGGQRKLLEFARALMAEPRLVLLDEPMAGVNRALGATLLDEVERLRREEGMTFLFIEHDIDIVMRRADQVVVMAEGRVVAEGPPDFIRRDQRVIDAYLGRRGNAA